MTGINLYQRQNYDDAAENASDSQVFLLRPPLRDRSGLLAPEEQGHLVERTAPGEKFVGGPFRDIAHHIVAGFLHGLGGIVDAVGAFLAAATHENLLDLVLVLDFHRIILAAAQEAVETEHLGTCQRDGVRLHAAHRQACHGAVVLVGQCAEVGIHIGHQFVAQHLLECLDTAHTIAALATGPESLVGHAVGADNDERLDFAFGNEVVHDEVGVALGHPSPLVLAPAVLEVEHRISHLGFVAVVGGRGIDKCAPQAVGALGPEQDLLYETVGNITLLVEGCIVCGNLYAALPTGRAIVVVN